MAFFKKYTIGRKIGSGGFGSVYLIKNAQDERFVVKLIDSSVVNKSIETEFEMLQELSKYKIPNTVKYIEHFASIDYKGKNYQGVVMEYVRGHELRDLFDCTQRQNIALPPHILLKFMEDMFETLSMLHEHNVVHRDVKLTNILFTNLKLTLVDFGFSCFVRVHTGIDPKLKCNAGRVQGTEKYLAPELFNILNKTHVGTIGYLKSADVWAMGVVFYELANLSRPFKNFIRGTKTNPKEFVNYKKSHYSAGTPEINEFINDIITRCLTYDYSERPLASDIYVDIFEFNHFKIF